MATSLLNPFMQDRATGSLVPWVYKQLSSGTSKTITKKEKKGVEGSLYHAVLETPESFMDVTDILAMYI